MSLATVIFIVLVSLSAAAAGAALWAISRIGRAETRLNVRLDGVEQRLEQYHTTTEGIRDDVFGQLRHVMGQNDLIVGRIAHLEEETLRHVTRFEDNVVTLQRTIKDVRNGFQEPRLDRAVMNRILERIEGIERRLDPGGHTPER